MDDFAKVCVRNKNSNTSTQVPSIRVKYKRAKTFFRRLIYVHNVQKTLFLVKTSYVCRSILVHFLSLNSS